jgi:hypothetical protein
MHFSRERLPIEAGIVPLSEDGLTSLEVYRCCSIVRFEIESGNCPTSGLPIVYSV